MALLPPNLIVRWMHPATEGERIAALRQCVLEEVGTQDEGEIIAFDECLHLGAFDGDELVALVTVYLCQTATDQMQAYGLPTGPWRVTQYSKCFVRKAYRDSVMAELLQSTLARTVHEVLRPRYVFMLLPETWGALAGFGLPAIGWELKGMAQTPNGERMVVHIPAGKAMEAAYRSSRRIAASLWEHLDKLPQSLVKHLDENGRMDLVARNALFSENLHSSPVSSLKDELPRLSAQTRLLFAEQKPRVAAVDFPKAPARLLDVGSGPGVYLTALGKTEKFKGYELMGLDASKEMVMYAKLNRSGIKWFHATAYETQQPDNSIDVVHLNFVLSHLMSPALALREFVRIMRPNGLLYIVDVNDSTFKGPSSMKALIEAHRDVCLSDRNVLNILPHIALEWGLELENRFATCARNNGTSAEPEFLPDEIRLDRIKMWALFSFLGQREELAAELKAAHETYFDSLEESSIEIQTHVYRLKNLQPSAQS